MENGGHLSPGEASKDDRIVSVTPIVNEQRFILATRSTGYRSTAAAVAELVDNSIQAKATIIRIFVEQVGTGSERQLTIAVLDNGGGMDAKTLSVAMQFAGSSRFDDRTGLGRFGMGLPNSSVSQARRVDVYTWRNRSRVLHSYLDVDEISSGEMKTVPKPSVRRLPEWADKYARKQTGTLVVWSRCDQLDHRKASTIADKLCRQLGQRFRHYLGQGNRIDVNETAVKPFDPLFLAVADGISPARAFGDELTFEFRKPSDPKSTSTVRVRFTELPVAEWHGLPAETKRELGIAKGAGVSIVRANREIDFGWYFMGGKRKENYDDWWRCEVSFDPELDELFGVTHSKQEINPTDLLRSELSQNLEAIAQTLNSRVRSAFQLVKKQELKSSIEVQAASREAVLPPANLPKPDPSPAPGRSNSKTKYRVRVRPLPLHDAFIWDANAAGEITLTVNENHALHDQVIAPLVANSDAKTIRGIECILLAFARAEISVKDKDFREEMDNFRRNFSNILASYLGD
jgi:hypothetical protein